MQWPCYFAHLLFKQLSGLVQGPPVDSDIICEAGEQHLGGEQEAVSLLELLDHLAIHRGERAELSAEMGLSKLGLAGAGDLRRVRPALP